MNLSKGQYVRHPKKPEWGVGEIIGVTRGGNMRVYFEKVGERTLDPSYVALTVVPDSEAEFLRDRALDPLAPHPAMDMDKVKGLCEQFKSEWEDSRTGYNDAGVAEEILSDLSRFGRLRSATYKRLAKWCHTDGFFAGGIRIAQEISLAIFGRVIERD